VNHVLFAPVYVDSLNILKHEEEEEQEMEDRTVEKMNGESNEISGKQFTL
jgi:hypothetical protein